MPAPIPGQDGEVVDLVAIATATEPLAAWWHRLSDLGQPCLAGLDRARRSLAGLSPVPGRLGRTIAVVVQGDPDRWDLEMADAIEMLVDVANRLRPPGSATGPGPAPAACPSRTAAGAAGVQLQLALGQQTAG